MSRRPKIDKRIKYENRYCKCGMKISRHEFENNQTKCGMCKRNERNKR